jgi:predicted nucleic acid-binding protein
VRPIIVLDTGPLGKIAHERQNPESNEWFLGHAVSGTEFALPEVCDYELRRELVRRGARKSLRHLDRLGSELKYLPVTTAVMRRAAELWAKMRNQGTPTADPKQLDVDVILCATVQLESERTQREHVVATTNVRHLARMVPAKLWSEI